MAGRKRERYEIEPKISVPFMLELEYENKIIQKLLVINKICSWLPPKLDGRKVCMNRCGDMTVFRFFKMAAVCHLGF